MRTVEEHQRVVAGLISARTPVAVALPDALGLVLAADVAAAARIVAEAPTDFGAA